MALTKWALKNIRVPINWLYKKYIIDIKIKVVRL